MSTIGDRIKEKRKQLGLTQLELGNKLNITDKAVSKWEQNEGNPDISMLPLLSNVLNVSIDYLITGKMPEEKIIIKSPKEMLFETDDPQYLEKISVNDLNIQEIYENKLANTFGYLVDNREILKYLPQRTKYGGGFNGYVRQILYMLLISNRLEKIRVFDFNDFGFADDKEITNEMLDELVSEKRVNDETRNYVLNTHCRELISVNQGPSKNTETYHVYGNWQSLYPKILNKFAYVKKWDWVEKMLDMFLKINDKGAGVYQQKKKNKESFPYTYVVFEESTRYSSDYIRVVTIYKDTLDLLLNEGQYDLLKKANYINEQFDYPTISKRNIELHKMKNSNASEKEKLIFEFVQNGILNYNALFNRNVEIDGINPIEEKEKWYKTFLKRYKDLYHEIIMEYPISYIELTYKGIVNGELSYIFQLAVDNNIGLLTNALIDGREDVIIAAAKDTLTYFETNDGSKVDYYNFGNEQVYRINNKWVKSSDIQYKSGLICIPDTSEIPNNLGDAIKYFDKFKDNIFNAWVNSVEDKIESQKKSKENKEIYNIVKSEVSIEQLYKRIEDGNTDSVAKDLYKKLENILKHRFGYEGEGLGDLLYQFYNDKFEISDNNELLEEDNYYGKVIACSKKKELNNKFVNWEKQLDNFRKWRNSLFHAVKNDVEFTNDDLKTCVEIIVVLEN